MLGPMGPMGNKSFESPYAAPLPGESIFRIPTFDPPDDGGGGGDDDGGGGGTHPARPAPSQHAQGPNIP